MDCNLIRGVRQLTRGQNIDWNDLFRLAPGTQEARKRQLLQKLEATIPNITPAERTALADRLNKEWEEKRGKIIEREIKKRLPKDATKETKQKLSRALPKLVQQINLGSLNNETLQELLSAEFGVGLTDPDVVRKLSELSEKAQAAPNGIARFRYYMEMQRVLEDSDGFTVMDAIKSGDWWFASVLMRFGTFANVVSGSFLTAIAFEGMMALDAALIKGRPDIALKQLGAFVIGVFDGVRTINEIVGKGNYALLLDAEKRTNDVLSGKKGKDILEALKRRGNLAGNLAYTRRIMAYLDYIAAQGVRDSAMIYAALERKDQKSLQILDRRWDKKLSAEAYEQAKRDLGDNASNAELRKRQREILEEGINKDIEESAINLSRRSAQNADPVGLAGVIYNGIKRMRWWAKAPLGLAFARAALNTISTASDFIPGLGLVSYWRSSDSFQSKYADSDIGKFFGLPLTPEERRIVAWSQVVGFGMVASLLSWAMTDDDDDGFEISGGWQNVTPQQAKELRALGLAPYQIKIPGTSFRFSYRQSPLAPVLAMIGAIRDNKKYDKEKWDEQSIVEKLYLSWERGLMFVKDIASLGQIAYALGANAGRSEEAGLNQLNDYLSRSIGRAAGGMVPSVINEIFDIADPTMRIPLKDDILGKWAKNFPVAEYLNRPALNFLGDPVELTKPPLRGFGTWERQEPIYRFVGKWAAEGLFPRQAAMGTKVWDPSKNEMRQITPSEFYEYQAVFGATFKSLLEQALPSIENLERPAIVQIYKRFGEASAKVARARVQQRVLGVD